MEIESCRNTLRGWEREELWHRQTAGFSVRGYAAARSVAEWKVCGYQCVFDVGERVATKVAQTIVFRRVLFALADRTKRMASPTFVKVLTRSAACRARLVVHSAWVDHRFGL